jgi:hypothetical protein
MKSFYNMGPGPWSLALGGWLSSTPCLITITYLVVRQINGQNWLRFCAKKIILRLFCFRFNIKLVESAGDVDNAFEALHKGNDSIVRYVLDMDKCTAN